MNLPISRKITITPARHNFAGGDQEELFLIASWGKPISWAEAQERFAKGLPVAGMSFNSTRRGDGSIAQHDIGVAFSGGHIYSSEGSSWDAQAYWSHFAAHYGQYAAWFEIQTEGEAKDGSVCFSTKSLEECYPE